MFQKIFLYQMVVKRVMFHPMVSIESATKKSTGKKTTKSKSLFSREPPMEAQRAQLAGRDFHQTRPPQLPHDLEDRSSQVVVSDRITPIYIQSHKVRPWMEGTHHVTRILRGTENHGLFTTSPSVQQARWSSKHRTEPTRGVLRIGFIKIRWFAGLQLGICSGAVKPAEKTITHKRWAQKHPKTSQKPVISSFFWETAENKWLFTGVKKPLGPKIISLQLWLVGARRGVMFRCPNQQKWNVTQTPKESPPISSFQWFSGLKKIVVCHPGPKDLPPVKMDQLPMFGD